MGMRKTKLQVNICGHKQKNESPDIIQGFIFLFLVNHYL